MPSFSSNRARRLTQLLGLAAAAWLGVAGIRKTLVGWWSLSDNPDNWRRAVRLDPSDANLWWRIGLLEQWDFSRANSQQALEDLEHAARLNPHAAPIWLDLAMAYEAGGKVQQAAEAYRRAREAFPRSADVSWQYGNFLLRQGKPELAAASVQRALQVHPELLMTALGEFARAGYPPAWLVEHVLPPQPSAALRAVEFFLAQGDLDGALLAWGRAVSQQAPVPLPQSVGLVTALLNGHRFAAARTAWQQALQMAGIALPDERQPVYNGDFERDPLNGGFDWHLEQAPGVRVELDPVVTCSGHRSVRLRFDGTQNVAFQHVYELVPVRPGARYRLRACVRTQGLTTDQGIWLAVTPVDQPDRILGATSPLTGTQPWHEVEAELTVCSECPVVVLSIRRSLSSHLDNQIAGTAWVDRVRLEAME
jgi:hypothetical protein